MRHILIPQKTRIQLRDAPAVTPAKHEGQPLLLRRVLVNGRNAARLLDDMTHAQVHELVAPLQRAVRDVGFDPPVRLGARAEEGRVDLVGFGTPHVHPQGGVVVLL